MIDILQRGLGTTDESQQRRLLLHAGLPRGGADRCWCRLLGGADMSTHTPPRVRTPALSHVGVCILWADDFSHCRARYLNWNVRIEVDPLDALDPSFRQAVENCIYLKAIEQFQ